MSLVPSETDVFEPWKLGEDVWGSSIVWSERNAGAGEDPLH